MAEENPQPNPDEGKDYKLLYEQTLKESRKWESYAKENLEKAKQFDALSEQSKTTEERIAALEAENMRMSAEKKHAELVNRVAETTGVSAGIVSTLSAQDEETLTAQAKAIADAYKTPGGAPNVSESGKFPNKEGGEPKALSEKKQFIRDLMSNTQ